VSDDSLVVDMGQVIIETPYLSIFKRYAIATTAMLFLALGPFVYYGSLNINVTIILDSNNIQTVSKILLDDGVEIVSIEKIKDSSYEIRLKTFKNIKSLVEKLKNNQEIENIDIK
jgi:hypothetical protein